MSKRSLSKLLGEPANGYLSLLEKDEIILRQGVPLNRQKIHDSLVMNQHTDFKDQVGWNDFCISVFKSKKILIMIFLRDLKLKILDLDHSAKISIHIVFNLDQFEFVIKNKEIEKIFPFTYMGNDITPEFISSLIFAVEDPQSIINLRLVHRGLPRQEIIDFLSNQFISTIEEFKSLSIRILKEYLIISEDYDISKNRLKIFYPDLNVKNLSISESASLLMRANFNMIHFDNLESYYYFYKDALPSANRSNHIILKDMARFDKKLSKITA
jgi:hypothetical protein